MSRKTSSPLKETQLMQHLARLERSPSLDDHAMYGSQSSINLDDIPIDLPREAKRRRLMADDTAAALNGSQVSSQMSSRSHSPSWSESMYDDSLVSTPSASPSGTLKEHFRRKYRKDELWASIETNYKYLMDKGIIEACQSTDMEAEPASVNSNISFGEFVHQYKELSDWLKTIQTTLNQKASTTLALSEKYLNRSYYEEMKRSPKLQLLNDYGVQLKTCQPALGAEVDVFLRELTTQWDAIYTAVTPSNLHQDVHAAAKDLEGDLASLKTWLDGIEDHLRTQMSQPWQYEQLQAVLDEHRVQQRDIESHSRVISAVLKLSDQLHDTQPDSDESLELAAHNLETRWHGIWLQSLEWQCRLEDALTRKKGISNPTPYSSIGQKYYTDDDDDYDSHDVSGAEEGFPGLAYRSDFIQTPPKSDSSTSYSPFDTRSGGSGKDSAVVSESEIKTGSDMSESYLDFSLSNSDSDREFLRQITLKKHDNRDIGYGSESHSDDLDGRNKGITFTGISGKSRSKSGGYYATVAVDTESTDKMEGWNSTANNESKSDESDVNTQCQKVLQAEEPQMEDIRYLIDQADIMVQQGNTFNKAYSPQLAVDCQAEASKEREESSACVSSSGQAEMIDKGVGTVESSCDASDEESGESDGQQDDGTDAIDSVLASEYTSDEMRNGVHDYSKLPKLYDTSAVKARVKGQRARGDRPWSVIELTNVMEVKPLSASEGAIDKLSIYSDSDLPSGHTRTVSKSASPTFQRRARKIHRPGLKETTPARSQIGAKRKLDLNLVNTTLATNSRTTCTVSNTKTKCADKTLDTTSIDPVNFNRIASSKWKPGSASTPVNTEPVQCDFSGTANRVPLSESCATDDETFVTHSSRTDMILTLQNARFKSSGSSNDDSDTQGGPTAASEIDDANNDGNFSENAWDNYQAPLYTTGSEEGPEEALTWEPGEMEFDDEFSLPQSTILATLMARRSDESSFTGKQPKLVPSSQGQFEDSDSDIEDLHHVLEESRMQLKVADRSLKKKRKDPLKTGLYLNPGKYGELMATIETNIRCLETISEHLDQADVSDQDLHTIQDLLYQWEKLHALASDRRNQSQELKSMYATYLTIQGSAAEGILAVEKKKFHSIEELQITALKLQDRQKFLVCQKGIVGDLRSAVTTFSAQNCSVSMTSFLDQITATETHIEDLLKTCMLRLGELEHVQRVWEQYQDSMQELQLLLTELLLVLNRAHSSTQSDTDRQFQLQLIFNSLSLYEERMVALQRLRGDLANVIDDDTQNSMTGELAAIVDQLYTVQKQYRELISECLAPASDDTDFGGKKTSLKEKDGEPDFGLEAEERMEVDDDVTKPTVKPAAMTTRRHTSTPRLTKVAAKRRVPVENKAVSWTRSFPFSALAIALFLGLLYLFAPQTLHRFLDWTLNISPELDYVNGPPPV